MENNVSIQIMVLFQSVFSLLGHFNYWTWGGSWSQNVTTVFFMKYVCIGLNYINSREEKKFWAGMSKGEEARASGAQRRQVGRGGPGPFGADSSFSPSVGDSPESLPAFCAMPPRTALLPGFSANCLAFQIFFHPIHSNSITWTVRNAGIISHLRQQWVSAVALWITLKGNECWGVSKLSGPAQSRTARERTGQHANSHSTFSHKTTEPCEGIFFL